MPSGEGKTAMFQPAKRRGTHVFGSILKIGCAALATMTGIACSGETDLGEPVNEGAEATKSGPQIDVRRSLVVTEQPILERFPLQKVLERIISTSGARGMTPLGLFQQWWDTQNPSPGLDPSAPHCDDTTDANGVPTLNGYPYTCRAAPAEGAQASCDPFSDPNSACAYIPVGLFMRFDAAPADGSHCGEYRVVYAKQTGRTAAFDRNLIIFEAAARNPHPNQGLRGCRKLVEAWADLSSENDIQKRADRLEEIYFDGYQAFDPIIQWDNFGDNEEGAGQVRTNQFVQSVSPKVWSLREFKIYRSCTGRNCKLRFVAATSKNNPFGPLFDPASQDANAAAFRTELVSKIGALAAQSLTDISLGTADSFNSGQSQANGTETDYYVNFGNGPSALRDDIQAKLTAVGSSLTPDDVVARAQAMSCAGCHQLCNAQSMGGNLSWPPSLGFTHISERDADLETNDGVTRYRISPALTDVFLPRRAEIVRDYLADIPHGPKAAKARIGNEWED